VLAISVDKNDKENVGYIPIKAKAGYNDPQQETYLDEIKKILFSLQNQIIKKR